MTLQEFLDKKYTKEEQKNLTKLNCSYNNLTSLNGIENLTKLTQLDCYGNNFKKIN